MYVFSMVVYCQHLIRQISSVAQIFNSSSQVFSTVKHLTVEHKVHSRSSEVQNEADDTGWREFLQLGHLAM